MKRAELYVMVMMRIVPFFFSFTHRTACVCMCVCVLATSLNCFTALILQLI